MKVKHVSKRHNALLLRESVSDPMHLICTLNIQGTNRLWSVLERVNSPETMFFPQPKFTNNIDVPHCTFILLICHNHDERDPGSDSRKKLVDRDTGFLPDGDTSVHNGSSDRCITHLPIHYSDQSQPSSAVGTHQLHIGQYLDSSLIILKHLQLLSTREIEKG